MVGNAPATATSEKETGTLSAEYGTGATFAHYKRQESVPPRHMQAEAVERLRERIEEIGSQWAPDYDIDVEEMLREA